jgi:hypothetical protein
MSAAALKDDLPDRLVTLSNWRQAPFSAWGFRNVRRLIPPDNMGAILSQAAKSAAASR